MEFVKKPWGVEVHLFKWKEWRLKLLVVNEGHRTSLQYHEKKEEFWFYMDGKWKHLPPKKIHRLAGSVTVLEISRGEDTDIIRLEDDYNR
jgi:hypothetical protein